METAGDRPLRLTKDKHPAYRKAIRWVVGKKALHRTGRYLNNQTEQSHRHIKQRYYPMLGFKRLESASRFYTAFDELRNYLRIRASDQDAVSASDRRLIYRARWSTPMAELST